MKELHTLSDFLTYPDAPSQIVPGKRHQLDPVFYCPKCGNETTEPEHGVHDSCDGCGLKWIAFGNAIYLESLDMVRH